MKFDRQKVSKGVKLAFRKSDGTKTEHIFSNTSTVKVRCWVIRCINVFSLFI